MTILEVQDLQQSYKSGVAGLRDVSFTVEAGEFVGIIGPSGAGKSTLLRCINRLVEPSVGRILVPQNLLNGRNGPAVDVLQLEGPELRQLRRRIGMIFQQFNIVKRLSVMENVLSGALGDQPVMSSTLRIFSREAERRALANLKRVGLLELAYKRADELSGGEQQRVAIARTLMQRPGIILADEPVASLDPKLSRVVLDILQARLPRGRDHGAGEPSHLGADAGIRPPGHRTERRKDRLRRRHGAFKRSRGRSRLPGQRQNSRMTASSG